MALTAARDVQAEQEQQQMVQKPLEKRGWEGGERVVNAELICDCSKICSANTCLTIASSVVHAVLAGGMLVHRA